MSTSRPPSASPAGENILHAAPADVRDNQSPTALGFPSTEAVPGTLIPQPETKKEGDDNGYDDDDADSDSDTEAVPYPEPFPGQPIAHPPDFRPFFILIEDASSGEHHHPTVHYIFTDDDPDLLTNAALEAVDHDSEVTADDDIRDRSVILDLSPDGKQVISATSLSPDWQALATKISPAPSWGREDGSAAERGLMLRISGREANVDTMTGEIKRKGDLEGLLKAFDEQLHRLHGVLGSDDAEVDIRDTQAAQ